jgi:hypothetical protein
MRFLSIAAATIVLSLSAAALSGPVGAAETGNLYNCTQLGSQVDHALASNTQSPSYDAAKKEKGYGRDFCANGLYDRGVMHYAQALKLLGSEKSGSNSSSSSS